MKEENVIQYASTYEFGDNATNNPSNPPSYTVEDDIVLGAPDRPGYAFKGWTPDSGVITNGTVGAKTYTAIWELVSVLETEPTYTVGTKCSIDTGWIGYTVKNLPKGLKYDKKTGIVSGVPTAATSGKVVATFTKKGKETQTLEFTVAALPSGATGTFNGFVVAALGDGTTTQSSDVSSPTSSETANAGSLQVTVSDVGKVAAKVVAVSGTYSFTATGWDSVNEGVYAVEAQKNAFGAPWFFKATGDDANGWTLSFAENAKAATLTVALKADGTTSVSGKLGGNKITASGYADVSGIAAGAILVDFAPVVTVGRTKKVLYTP